MTVTDESSVGLLEGRKGEVSFPCELTKEQRLNHFSQVIEDEVAEWRELRPTWTQWMENCNFLISPIICSDGRMRSSSFGFPIGAIRPIRIAGTLFDPNAFRMEVTRKAAESEKRGKLPLILKVFHSDCFAMGSRKEDRLKIIIQQEKIIRSEFPGVSYLALFEDILEKEDVGDTDKDIERLTLYGSNIASDPTRIFTTRMANESFHPKYLGNKVMMQGNIRQRMKENDLFAGGLLSTAAHIMADNLLVSGLRKILPQSHEEQMIVLGRGLCWLFDSSAFVITADIDIPPLMEEAWRSVKVGLGLIDNNIPDNSPIIIVTSYTHTDGNHSSYETAMFQANAIKQFVIRRLEGHIFEKRVKIAPVVINKANCELTWLEPV